MASSDRLKFLFSEPWEFEGLLKLAYDAASKKLAERLLAMGAYVGTPDMHQDLDLCVEIDRRFQRYRGDMFITQAQLSRLKAIAGLESK